MADGVKCPDCIAGRTTSGTWCLRCEGTGRIFFDPDSGGAISAAHYVHATVASSGPVAAAAADQPAVPNTVDIAAEAEQPAVRTLSEAREVASPAPIAAAAADQPPVPSTDGRAAWVAAAGLAVLGGAVLALMCRRRLAPRWG